MAKQHPKRLLRELLLSALLTSASPASALQTIEARDGVSVEGSIALKEPTRIKVEGTPIVDVFGNIYSSNCAGALATTNPQTGQNALAINPAGEIALECDKDKGEIYVKPVAAGAKPVNLFVSTGQATYTLVLKRVDMPAETIVIRDRTGRQQGAQARVRAGRSPSHLRALKQMLIAMASERVPPDMRVQDVSAPVTMWAEARVILQRTFEGRDLLGHTYLLTNVSGEAMVLAEQEFDRDEGDVVGVAIETHNLRPGESTQVFVIRAGS